MAFQAPLPPELGLLGEAETRERIASAKSKLGQSVVVLGHHYQRDEIIEHADYRGDSYRLARDAANHPEADFIVFCGVHFMAESADILTPESQRVILPNLAAGCSMADMAGIFQVRNAWKQLSSCLGDKLLVPVTYINSAASLKAFVGEHGGTVCTSSNAASAVRWAIEQGDKVLFFPDQHLGRNTAVRLGFDPEADMVVWDPYEPLGGNSPEDLHRAKFFLWKGHCSVHKRFTVDQISDLRIKFPPIRIVVHPECELEVVRAADSYGSTEAIIQTVSSGKAGDVWGVGTEVNLVKRLAKEHPDQTVVCLDPDVCPCSTMYRIHPSFLLWTLEQLVEGRVTNVVKVPENTAVLARKALDQMLRLPTS